ncbi:pantothenate kinase [Limnospira fusiformis]|uniref:pantothenate kinase n=1 Tax=Limnospira fusiformis TaxID=54297 RepID=UPI0014497B88|nr:pantothenate kinase [Limnospira fusiformis SAG 85.79]
MMKLRSHPPNWLGLMIGNSRLHWGKFQAETLVETWDTQHLNQSPLEMGWSWLHQISPVPLFIASVVPEQMQLWQNYPQAEIITLELLPLGGLYPTFGIDRGLAVLGAGNQLGFPILVIDAGTALTLTGVNQNRQLIGGAILPGLGLQFSSLSNRTATLPQVAFPESLPQRWGVNTSEAIASGIIHSMIAGLREFITAWCQEFPHSKISITGGDRIPLMTYLNSQYPKIAALIVDTPEAIFWGMSAMVRDRNLPSLNRVSL